jgi:N-acetylmuramic acid 6-phosphate etherase
MIRLGRVYRGLMVDLKAVNKKLIRRSEEILTELSGCSRDEAHEALRRADGNVKTALLLLEGCDLDEASRPVHRSAGHLCVAKALIETGKGGRESR